jgi:hypothetical protein
VKSIRDHVDLGCPFENRGYHPPSSQWASALWANVTEGNCQFEWHGTVQLATTNHGLAEVEVSETG